MGYPVTTVAMATHFWVLKFVGVPQSKPMNEFDQIFWICLPKGDLEVISILGYLATTVAVATLLRFLGFNVCGCSRIASRMRFLRYLALICFCSRISSKYAGTRL